MPWDATELHVAQLDETGNVTGSRLVAGRLEESVLMPKWSPDGTLYFISDRSGWWNIYRCSGEDVAAVFPKDAEFAGPSWIFGLSTYDFESAESLLCVYKESGQAQFTRVDTRTVGREGGPETQRIETPF
jgi:hypothetical protein